ncbi:MAG TPA: glycosyl transferase family 2 [Crenotrichaceae bacterium]|nr:glycosyl transferase family 2 [Crenotrichaceae bacterium]
MGVFRNLSIVIPVGPGDESWRKLVAELVESGINAEIILCASTDQPGDIDFPAHVEWIVTSQGRAGQLNVGANQSSRRFIWFVHADTCLTASALTVVNHYLQSDKRILGYFRLRFASDGPWQTHLNALAANIRSRLFDLPFGDQGLIMHKSLFEQVDGFDENLVLGEDLDFVVRVKAAGFQLVQLPAELVTSARRYQQQGWLPTTMRHVWLTWSLTRQARQRIRFA